MVVVAVLMLFAGFALGTLGTVAVLVWAVRSEVSYRQFREFGDLLGIVPRR